MQWRYVRFADLLDQLNVARVEVAGNEYLAGAGAAAQAEAIGILLGTALLAGLHRLSEVIIYAQTSYDFWYRYSASSSTGSSGMMFDTSSRPSLRIGTTNSIR